MSKVIKIYILNSRHCLSTKHKNKIYNNLFLLDIVRFKESKE
jgi:hypothetical protein